MDNVFRIVNDYGTTFLDDTYKNLTLISKGTLQINSGTTGFITFNGTNPVLAVRCQEGVTIAVVSTYFANNVWNAELRLSAQGAGTTVSYYVFDLIPPANTPFVQGHRLWNAAGELIFDSELPYLRVIDILQNSDRSQQSINFQAMEAVVFLTPTIDQLGGSGGYTHRTDGFVLTNGHFYPQSIDLGYTDTSDNGTNPTNEPTYDYNSIMLVIDVTNL